MQINFKALEEIDKLIESNPSYFTDDKDYYVGQITNNFVFAYSEGKPLPYKKTPPVDLAEEMNELLSGVTISRNSLQGED
jgi:hypothetical protein